MYINYLNSYYSQKYENIIGAGISFYKVSPPWKKNAMMITLTATVIFLGYLAISFYRSLSGKHHQVTKNKLNTLPKRIVKSPNKETQKSFYNESIQQPRDSEKEKYLKKDKNIPLENQSIDTPPQGPLSDREKEKFLKSLENIPKGCAHFDLRGTQWLDNMHIFCYFHILKETFPQLNETGAETYRLESIKKSILANHSGGFIAHPLHVLENHWTLVIFDRQKRTLEYYDPKMNYGNHVQIVKELNELANTLTKQDKSPGQPPYTFDCKIKKRLQEDGYECGPWTLYFLEERLKNPNVNFNLINSEKAKTMMAEHRIKLSALLVDWNR